MKPRKITIFAGHYGSGKSSIAVNYAIHLKKSFQKEVIIGDLDIVNPYFRTKDSEDRLRKSGIQLISPAFANTNVDLPSVSGEMNVIFDAKDAYGVIDLGGDERGAYALGRYHDLLKEKETDFFLVINMFRPLTRDSEHTLIIMKEIEHASRIKFTGIVNNSNVGTQTTAKDILDSIPYAQEVSKSAGIPIVMTTVRRDLADRLPNDIGTVFPLDLEEYQW